MIGVVATPAELEVAREFFELCKTPWESYRDSALYDLVICTSASVPIGRPRLVLAYGGTALENDAEMGFTPETRHGAVLSYRGRQIPVYGPSVTFPGSRSMLLKDESSREAAIDVRHQDGTTVVRVGYSLFDEVKYLLETGQPIQFAQSPTLELHAELLRDLATRSGVPFVEIPPVPRGSRFIACLTHDVDHPLLRNHRWDHTMAGFLFRSTFGSLAKAARGRLPIRRMAANWLAALRLPLVHLGIARDFWSDFDRYLEIERGKPSTFFIIPRRDYPGRRSDGSSLPKRASKYMPEELKPQLDRVLDHGGEVALHGLDAWIDAQEGRREQETLGKALNVRTTGVRMHWLWFDAGSPAQLEQAGFSYDSSVGYNQTAGFRSGTTQVYRPPGVQRLRELPLHIMDTALFYPDYLDLSEAEATQLVSRLTAEAVRFGGALTINWHDRSIAPERHWDTFYQTFLLQLENAQAWFATAGETVAWFEKRRSASVKATALPEGGIRLEGSIDSPNDSLPGLLIRVHKPCVEKSEEALTEGSRAAYEDIAFDRSLEMTIAL